MYYYVVHGKAKTVYGSENQNVLLQWLLPSRLNFSIMF